MQQDWVYEAACYGYPLTLFFPQQGQNAYEALSICWQCPVIKECYDYAMSFGEDLQGVYGGTTQRERIRRIRESRRENGNVRIRAK